MGEAKVEFTTAAMLKEGEKSVEEGQKVEMVNN